MAVLRDAPESKFAYVTVASRRARQLMEGARPFVDNPKSRKPTRIAQEELENSFLEFELPNPVGGTDDKEGKRRKG